VDQDGMKLKGTHQLLVYADDIIIYGAEAYILQGDQKVSVHLMITKQKFVMFSVPCQFTDIY
jgi:alkyl hydroperoxide reductase subunit AhpC